MFGVYFVFCQYVGDIFAVFLAVFWGYVGSMLGYVGSMIGVCLGYILVMIRTTWEFDY